MAFIHWLQTFALWMVSHWEVWFWPVLTGFITFAVKRKYPERWEKWALKYPVGALVIEFMRAYGFDSQKGPVILQRFAMRRAGLVPPDAIKSISVPDKVMKVLLDPALRHRLTIAAEVMLKQSVKWEEMPVASLTPPEPTEPPERPST